MANVDMHIYSVVLLSLQALFCICLLEYNTNINNFMAFLQELADPLSRRKLN